MPKPALVGAALLLLLNLSSLAAALYANFAEQRLDLLPDLRASRASALAAALAPWSATHRALHGWVLGDSGDFESAQAAYLGALRRAPADALLWAEYAQVLGRNRVFDERLTAATQRALALAPASPAVRQGISRMALAYGLFGEGPVRELWRQNLRWELDHSRETFLHTVQQDGYRRAFCLKYAPDLGESAWCASP